MASDLRCPRDREGATRGKSYLPGGMVRSGRGRSSWAAGRSPGGRPGTTPLTSGPATSSPMARVKQYTDEAVEGPTTSVVYPRRRPLRTLQDDGSRPVAEGRLDGHRPGWEDGPASPDLRSAEGRRGGARFRLFTRARGPVAGQDDRAGASQGTPSRAVTAGTRIPTRANLRIAPMKPIAWGPRRRVVLAPGLCVGQ